MPKIPTYKTIPVSQAIIDFEYNGYKTSKDPGMSTFGSCVYKGNGVAWSWGKSDRPVDGIIELFRSYTPDEEEQWYKDHFDIKDSKTILNLFGLFHDMYDIGDAYHEMWNSWIKLDFYEMAVTLQDEDFNVIGIAPAPYGAAYIDNPVAVVAEEKNGTRFWCHADQKWIDDMREQIRPVYEAALKDAENKQ